MDHAEFYRQQISLTEWLEGIKSQDTAAFRTEDFQKYALHNRIGLPYAQPREYPALAVKNREPEIQELVREHGRELCMIRLVPLDPGRPKLRMRGQTIAEALAWFDEQDIDPQLYSVYIVPHAEDHSWSTIFVVNEHGIFGEAIKGAHNQLTQGLYNAGEQPITFAYNYQSWALTPHHPEAEAYLRNMTAELNVAEPHLRAQLQSDLDAKFSAQHYLCGYFETTSSLTLGTWFIDYNRLLGELYSTYTAPSSKSAAEPLVSGRPASAGIATGRVRLVAPEDLATVRLEHGDILVCRMTTPDYLPLMRAAAAVVTDLGGILSHAAIIARELKLPCLTATGNATTRLKDGQIVTVDADAGVVKAQPKP
jgi:phosphohistidine swiveling domain-containing protein